MFLSRHFVGMAYISPTFPLMPFPCLFFRCFLVFLALSASSSALKWRRLGTSLAAAVSLLALPPGILANSGPRQVLQPCKHRRLFERHCHVAPCCLAGCPRLLARTSLVFSVFLIQMGIFALGCTGAVVEQGDPPHLRLDMLIIAGIVGGSSSRDLARLQGGATPWAVHCLNS